MSSSVTAVHQFHSGTAVGDAITSQMFFLQERLRRLGFQSEIFAEHIPDELRGAIRPLSGWTDHRDALLLVHHSMGHTAFDELMRLDVPMVTVFHSITPAHFFDDAGLRRYIRLGFAQLRRLADRSLFGVADSNHNREQMYDAGFDAVSVLPVKTDYSAFRAIRGGSTAGDDWLFVGRVVPNKRQLELVRAFATYSRAFSTTARLHLIGDLSLHGYVRAVTDEIDRLDLSDRVAMHGKVDDDALLAHYRDSGFFVCLSEHEGFGVPLLEAMAAGLPVIARDAAAVGETLGGAGVLIDSSDPSVVAALAHTIAVDSDLRERLVHHQDERLRRLERFDVDVFLGDIVARAMGGPTPLSVQIQGPFETSYSLAILNRELSLALASDPDLDVSIYATEGPGDYEPAPSDLAAHPAAAALYAKSGAVTYPDVAIRQMYPPRVHDSTAGLTMQYFGWEESRLPAEYVADFNRYLDGIGTMSSFVRDVLAESGVTVPTAVVGVGVHRPDPDAVLDIRELADLRTTRFLHISSAFPRKGVDVLLEAFVEAFEPDADVTLILKTFPNPHNDVASVLDRLRSAHGRIPDVRWIDRDLDRAGIDAMYGLATAYVHPARGEGFGLPVAEAMLAEVPVIAVAATGLADFVSDRTAAVVGHRPAVAASHLSVPGSMWVEPNRDDLVRELRSVANGEGAGLRVERVVAARDLIAAEYSWPSVATRWRSFIRERRRHRRGLTVAMVTTYNSRCGIAEYSADLRASLGPRIDASILADVDGTPIDPLVEESVDRVWANHLRQPVDELLRALDRCSADLVHVQHNFGFFTLPELGRIICHQAPRRPVVVTLHRTSDLETTHVSARIEQISAELRLADAVIVHQMHDVARLADAGVDANVHLVPIGADAPLDIDMQDARDRHDLPRSAFVVATFGFLLPHKGTLQLIRAVAELQRRGIDARLVAACALHPHPSSAEHLAECMAEIQRLGLGSTARLVADYMPEGEVRDLLSAADVLALPYQSTNESSSAALRFLLPIGRPIVTSDLPIFGDAAAAVMQVPRPVTPEALADVLEQLWADPTTSAAVAARVRACALGTSWAVVGRRTNDLYDRIITTPPRQRRAGGG
ncbi:MAG: glycosyltransferase [Ilumatobacteraceae bacterium]